MPDKQTEKPMSAIPEKFILYPNFSRISPAWADYMEAFAKEMAEAVANKWRRPNTNYCNCCVAYARLVSYDNWECNHEPTCPVPRAQEYLEGK